MKKGHLLSLATIGLVAGCCLQQQAFATPYASGVTNSSGTISFTLNESTDNVSVRLNNGASTNDLGALGKGVHSFPLDTATNFQIVVRKISAPGFYTTNGSFNTNTLFGATNFVANLLQISADTNQALAFNQPRGVAINRDPKSAFFGRFYVANAMAGTTTSNGVSRPVGDGIYALNADQTDAIGQGDTAATAGLESNFSAGGTNASPWRISVGQDGNLYICDWSDSQGNLYRTDPNVGTGTGVAMLKALTGSAAIPLGAANNHGSISAAHVEGSIEAGNLRVYTIDEDMQVDRTTTALTQMNSLWRYDVNSTVPFEGEPTKLFTSSVSAKDGYPATSQRVDMRRGADGRFYVVTYRSGGNESGLTVLSATGSRQWHSHNISTNRFGGTKDVLAASYAVAVSANQRFVAVTRDSGATWILPLTNGLPDISKRVWLNTFAQHTTNVVRAADFDAAGNLHVVSSANPTAAGTGTGHQLLRIYSPGGNTTTITGNDLSGTNGTFQLIETPTIITQPEDVTANAGTSATFTVIATGANPTYQWRFNGANVANATASTYVRANVQATGNISVIVSTPSASVTSSNAVLTVIPTAPIITVEPVSRTTNAGVNVTFSVTTTGSDPRIYQWRFNGTNIAGATASAYTRPNVQDLDQGNYSVYVVNTNGNATSLDASLTVTPSAPIVTALSPINRTVPAGSNITFTVTAPGTDPRTYQWYFNSGLVEGATNSTFVITNTQLVHLGDYMVIVQNSLGSASTNTTLTVTNTPLRIVTQPANQTNGTGGNATFSVLTWGEDPRTYQWQFNGTDIPDATSRVYVRSNLQSVVDAGTYTVLVTDTYAATALSSNAVLTITNRVPTIVTQPTNVTVTVGQTAVLSVVAQGQAPLTYQWRIGTNNITDATAATFSLPNAQLADAATNYNVVVTSPVGSTTSQNAQIAVTDTSTPGTGTGLTADYYSSQLQTLTGTPFTRIDPTVDFLFGTGSPDPAVSSDWFSARWTGQVQPLYSQTYDFFVQMDDGARLWVDGKLLVNSWTAGSLRELRGSIAMTAGQKYNIVLEYFEQTSSGEVHLRWSSPSQIKEIIRQSQLYPTSGPSIVTQPMDQVVVAGTNATFSVVAVGRDTLTYQWSKGLNPITGATGSSLTITNVQAGDVASYSVKVTNGGGDASSTGASLSIATPPAITTQPQPQSVAAGATATFTVAATGNPLFFQWNFAGSPITGQTNNSLSITNVQIGNVGNYSVLITNIAGFVLSDNAALSLTATEAPTMSISGSGGNNLSISWTGGFILQSATNVAGPYQTVSGASNPYPVSTTLEQQRFYRLISNDP